MAESVITSQEVDEELEAGIVGDKVASAEVIPENVEKTAEELAAEEQANATEVAKLDPRDEEIANLRAFTREQKRALDAIEAKLGDTNKVLEKANLISDEDKEAAAEMAAAQSVREEQLNLLLEVMEVNPKFEDVREVVSQQHFDELVEAMANALANSQGGDPKELAKALDDQIWSLANPYKYMYGMIRQYHPAYVKAPTGSEVVTGKTVVAEKAPVKIPTSLQDLPGGGGQATGLWTAAKIDDLPEHRLGEVPKDIYDKYMKGLLK